MIATPHSLTERLQLTPTGLRQRLHYLQLGPADLANMREIHRAIDGDLEAIMREFYAHLDRFEPLQKLLADAAVRARLLESMREYLRTLGEDPASMAWAERRLRIGAAHERIGLSLRWFLGAYPLLFAAIVARLAERVPGRLGALVITLHKVLTFDTELILESYHRAALDRVEELVQQLQKAQQQLQESSRHDDLTGALTRAAALESLDLELHRGRRFHQPFSLLILDIDCFKSINDQHGHAFGDHVLATVVQNCRRVLRPWDVLGRLGGDELVVGLLGCPMAEAVRIAERLRLEITGATFERGDRVAAVTVSIGVATATPATMVLNAMLEVADQELYRAKNGGRNRVCAQPVRSERRPPGQVAQAVD